MAISGDRRHAFVSIYRADRTPRLFEVDLASRRRVTVADALSPAVSAGDGRLAYVTTERAHDITYRTALVVRAGSDAPREIPMGTPAVKGIPPHLIVNWSPDGRRIAIFDEDEVRLVDPATAISVASQPAVAGRRLLAPAFLNDSTLIGLTNCCIGAQRLAAVNLTSGTRTPFATLPAPPENLGRVRRNLLFAVTAAQQLALVRKGKVRIIARGVAGAAS